MKAIDVGQTRTVSAALLPLRLVLGWMFLSAFHRRIVLAPHKLDADLPGYLGEKFNQFMPGAILGVDHMIAWLLDRPGALEVFLWSFTIIEGLVGVALIAGLGTRLAALGVALMSAGILFGAGWLGPTCLDEWQIGSLGVAGGATLMLAGAGAFSVDGWLHTRAPNLAARRWFRVLADPYPRPPRTWAMGITALAFVAALATNQVFHGGLWGPLRNDSVTPRVDVLAGSIGADGELVLTLNRSVGPETYGAFVVSIRVFNAAGVLLRDYDAEVLASLAPDDIDNRWLVKARPVPHGLLIPLGAEARVRLPAPTPGGPYVFEPTLRVILEDVSGLRWEQTVTTSSSREERVQAVL